MPIESGCQVCVRRLRKHIALGSVHKRESTLTDQSPVWQDTSHFQWDACALSLTPQITTGDCDYASDVPLPCAEPLPWEFVYASHCLTCPPWQCIPSPTHLICIALEGAEGIGGAMAFEVVPPQLEGYNLTNIVKNHNTNTRKLKI